MKVILIKEYKKHKVNEIIEVNDGFAKNFLIRNGYAQPVNSSTLANREKILEKISENEQHVLEQAQALAAEIEKAHLFFELKVHHDVVHGSITAKAITKEILAKHEIKLPNHSIDKVVLNTIGEHKVLVNLHPKVKPFLKVTIFEAK
ncbi:50S ribosomal protein L9 [Mycoplasma phocoenae]|uniref:Large ribosomal subunit protein bL9 n=1 Tax=Mycoplasma phocoenae TaxID=754517 RepID=A0A858U5T9_9MOLU|nr:50S ribosomal protein L9 [Mycoplasma phocoenae]QJG66807.1 50S ribosomal protein L9 [Mycoplasma phocoenae]